MGSRANGFAEQAKTGKTQAGKTFLICANNGRGAAYTFKHRPVRLVHSEAFQFETGALKRERQLKHWSHGKKEALVICNRERLKHVSKRYP